jgi:hypothetical protein
MVECYQIVSMTDKRTALDAQEMATFLAKEGQLLLPMPMVELIEQAQCAVDELVGLKRTGGEHSSRDTSAVGELDRSELATGASLRKPI